MKNSQKGFTSVAILIIAIAVLAIGGGVYVYESGKSVAPVVNNEVKQTDSQTNLPVNIQTNNADVSKQAVNDTLPSAILTVLKPSTNETWEIGTPHSVQWKLDTDFNRIHGTLNLLVYLESKSGNSIFVQGNNIEKNITGSLTVTTSYHNSEIVPGVYQLIFKVIDYDEIPCNSSPGGNIPSGNVTNCIGYSPIIASATSTSKITLTPSSGKVAPFLSSAEPNQINLGDTVSLSGVAFQQDSRVIFEGGYRSQDTWPMRIEIVPQFISTKQLKFMIPEKCNPPNRCISQDVKIEPYVYRVTVETKYGDSNAVVLYLKY